ncbi:hypothetical protein [Haloarchaeobius sp. DT45]|uniref:hypothetical protein n=1 Tax=Haloarchaeobius sp. DT45 TaxID=3446116 RepID=UPI003F6BD72B
MSAKANTGLEPRTGRDESPKENSNDAGRCYICGGYADGIDAKSREPICRQCNAAYGLLVKRALSGGLRA